MAPLGSCDNIFLLIFVCVHVYMGAFVCACACACACACVRVCVCACMCVCVCVHKFSTVSFTMVLFIQGVSLITEVTKVYI